MSTTLQSKQVLTSSSQESFEHIQSWLNEAKQYARQEAVYIVVGNKKDLKDDRNVEMLDAAKFAQENGKLL